jgi:hypothetical protein
MGTAATPTRVNRTSTVDCQEETTSVQLLGDGRAFVECVLAFVLALGLPLLHQATCRGGGCLTRHSPSARVRLGGRILWRLPGTTGRAGGTIRPHFVFRYRPMRPDVARAALVATSGGLSLALSAGIWPLSPMALSRLVGAFGPPSRVTVLTRGGRPLPVSCWADEQPSRCRTAPVALPTMVWGRVIWPLGDTAEARAAACPPSSGDCPRGASQHEPSYRVKGVLPEGCDSTGKRLPTVCPRARLGTGLRHALRTLPQQRVALASPGRQAGRSPCHPLWPRARQRQG